MSEVSTISILNKVVCDLKSGGIEKLEDVLECMKRVHSVFQQALEDNATPAQIERRKMLQAQKALQERVSTILIDNKEKNINFGSMGKALLGLGLEYEGLFSLGRAFDGGDFGAALIILEYFGETDQLDRSRGCILNFWKLFQEIHQKDKGDEEASEFLKNLADCAFRLGLDDVAYEIIVFQEGQEYDEDRILLYKTNVAKPGDLWELVPAIFTRMQSLEFFDIEQSLSRTIEEIEEYIGRELQHLEQKNIFSSEYVGYVKSVSDEEDQYSPDTIKGKNYTYTEFTFILSAICGNVSAAEDILSKLSTALESNSQDYLDMLAYIAINVGTYIQGSGDENMDTSGLRVIVGILQPLLMRFSGMEYIELQKNIENIIKRISTRVDMRHHESINLVRQMRFQKHPTIRELYLPISLKYEKFGGGLPRAAVINKALKKGSVRISTQAGLQLGVYIMECFLTHGCYPSIPRTFIESLLRDDTLDGDVRELFTCMLDEPQYVN